MLQELLPIIQSINQSINQLYLSVIGENLALLLIGDTISIVSFLGDLC